MYYMLRISIVVLMLVTTWSNPGGAQAVAQVTAGRVSGGPILSREISLNIERATVSDALSAIETSSSVRLQYSSALLPQSTRVTIHEQRITIANALRRILAGTGFEYRQGSIGEIAIVATRKSTAQGVIAGKVTDSKTGRGISGATVAIGNDVRETTTAEDGSYRLTGVPIGARTVTVRLVGYAKQVRSITVGEGITVTIDFKLEATANVLDQVVVTGTVAATELKAVPNAMTIITAKQIEERGITRLEQLFRGDVPGLFAISVQGGTVTENYGQVALFSRGATAIDNSPNTTGSAGISEGGPLTNNMRMYVDGVQLSDSNLKFLGQIDPKSIERIEILTGPQASTIYGAGAINGVIQIFTKRGFSRRPQFNLSFSSGLAESKYKKHIELNNYVTNLSLSGLEGRISYRLGTSWNHDGDWVASQQTNTFGGDGGVNISLGNKVTTDANVRWSRRLSSIKGAPGGTVPFGALTANGVMSQGFSGTTNQTSFTTSRSGGLTLNYRQFPWWSHRATVGFDAATYGRYKPAPGYANIGDTTLALSDRPGNSISQSYSSTMQLPLLSLASLNLTFGGDHSRSNVGNLGWNTTKITGKILTVPNDFTNSLFSVTKPNRHSGAYAQGMLGIKDALFFTYGVRADWDPAYGDDADVKPSRYGATFNQSFGFLTAKLRGSYGRSIRAPRRDLILGRLIGANQTDVIQIFGRYYGKLPNPELVPEDQRGGEGGIDLYFGNRASLSVTNYNQIVDNLIETFGSDSVRSLLPVAPNSYNCDERTPPFYDVIFDNEGYCYRYQEKSVNVGSIRNQGWELTGTMNLGPIRTTGSYSWTKSRILGINPKYINQLIEWIGPKFQVGAPFNYMPEHFWGVGMAYDNQSSSISLNVTGNGAQIIPISSTVLGITTSSSNRFTYTRERASLPTGVASLAVAGYANADLTARHSFSTRIQANLNVTNLANYYRNDYNAIYPSVGRQTRLGLQWLWQ